MKKLTKLLAVVMAVIMAVTVFIFPVSAATTCNCGNDPIVYVVGKQDIYVFDDDGNPIPYEGYYLTATEFDLDIGTITKECLPLFAKAFVTDSDEDWDALSAALVKDILPLYEGKGVNGDGEIIDPAHYNMLDENKSFFCNYNGKTHGYGIDYANYFYFDYRLPVSKSAEQLQEFVDAVKARTGHDKVTVITRCGGTNIVEAWLALYQEEKGFSDISSLVMLASCGNGLHSIEDLFSGELVVNTEGLYRLLSTYDLTELLGEEWGTNVELIIDMLKQTYGLDISVDMVVHLFDKIKDSVISPILREYYGSCGLELSLLKNNFYEAMDFLYPTQELKDEYAGVISDATLIHEKAIARVDELLKNLEDSGAYVGLICEYGFQTIPLSEDGNLAGEKTTTVKEQSYGATTSTVEGTLSDKYIASREEAGFGAYISPDKQIDASTGLFPDTTWYIKNANHVWSSSILDLAVEMTGKHITVTNGTYGQYLNYIDDGMKIGKLEPLQAVNDNDVQWKQSVSGLDEDEVRTSFFDVLNKWLQLFINFFRDFIMAFVDLGKAL